jgi:acyl-CoA synthetase (AMP-forming)/AMP-acid ligase II
VGWNFADVWEAVADRFPSSLALVHGDREVTWQAFDERADGVAAALLGARLSHQDKVAHYLRNGPEYLESMLAAFKAGLVPVNTNYRYADDELRYLWTNSDAAATIRDGWLSTGDVAVRDADGFIFIRDRIKDMITSGGENVYPAEIEDLLLTHPDVADAAVISMPSARRGESPLAVVVSTRPELDEQAVLEHCAGRPPATSNHARSSSPTPSRVTPPARSSSGCFVTSSPSTHRNDTPVPQVAPIGSALPRIPLAYRRRGRRCTSLDAAVGMPGRRRVAVECAVLRLNNSSAAMRHRSPHRQSRRVTHTGPRPMPGSREGDRR